MTDSDDDKRLESEPKPRSCVRTEAGEVHCGVLVDRPTAPSERDSPQAPEAAETE